MSLLIWIPLIIAVSLLVVLAVVAVLARIRGGALLRPIVKVLAKVPFLRRTFARMSLAAYERTNPELASALRKIQQFGEPTNPEQAQRMLRLLTPAERKAYLEIAGEQAAESVNLTNREQRRRAERGDLMKAQQRHVRGSGKQR